MTEKFDMERLRNALSAARMAKRLSQEQVATLLGCTRKWVSNFERGVSVPSFETVVAYAALFGIAILIEVPDGE
jgi:transcriptional regulator with XRE-family HTH domain